MKIDLKSHWDNTYLKVPTNQLGWHESNPDPSLQLIVKSGLNKSAVMLHVGVGSSTLIDSLLPLGYENIIANDISTQALENLKYRLGKDSKKVKWIIDDITNPVGLNQIEKIDLWHDRAVLHFFTSEENRSAYFQLINDKVKSGGFVVIAVFNLTGATKCSGLPVYRYSEEMLANALGNEFIMKDSFNFIYTTPSGSERPYIYTLFQRK